MRIKMCFYMDGQMVTCGQMATRYQQYLFICLVTTTDRDQTQPCVPVKLASVISQLIRMIGQKKMPTHTKKPHRGNFVNLNEKKSGEANLTFTFI